MKAFGIDVSRWQGDFNFEKAKKEGVEFVIIKAGGSDGGKTNTRYKDSKFERSYNECKRLGIPVGAYYFGNEVTEEQAISSAKHFIELLKGKQFEYPVYYDVESASMQKLSKQALTNIVDTFCKTVEQAGYYVGFYTSTSWITSELDDARLSKYTHWVAQWSKSSPALKASRLDMWQYGGETNLIRSNKIAGVTCDQNYCYVDFPKIIKNSNLNGYKKEAQKSVYPYVVSMPKTLQVYAEPSLQSDKVCTIIDGEQYDVDAESSGFAHISSLNGWVEIKYLRSL